MKASVLRRQRMHVVIESIAEHQARHGYAPSVRELQGETGLSSISVVWYWLGACERAGLIVRAPGLARTITLTEAGHALVATPPDEESPCAVAGHAA